MEADIGRAGCRWAMTLEQGALVGQAASYPQMAPSSPMRMWWRAWLQSSSSTPAAHPPSSSPSLTAAPSMLRSGALTSAPLLRAFQPWLSPGLLQQALFPLAACLQSPCLGCGTLGACPVPFCT